MLHFFLFTSYILAGNMVIEPEQKEGCVCCSKFSKQQNTYSKTDEICNKATPFENILKHKFIVCGNCEKHMCMYCAKNICAMITKMSNHNKMDGDIMRNDVWYVLVSNILQNIDHRQFYCIEHGNCCSFSSVIRKNKIDMS
jgi:hypothetical protein